MSSEPAVLSSRLAGWAARLGVILSITASYWLLEPGNHTEADDTFDYAGRVAGGLSSHELLARQVIFLPLGRSVLYVAERLGLGLDALQSLQLVSAMSTAAGLLVFHRYLRRGEGVDALGAAAGTLLLGASHGVWRYSMEADAYGLAILGGAAVLYGDAAWRDGRWRQRTYLLLGPVVMSLNLFLAIAYAVVPVVRMLRDHHVVEAVRHSVSSLVIGVATMGVWFALLRPGVTVSTWLSGGANQTAIGFDTPVRAIIGFGQTAVSTTFAFGFPQVRDRLDSAFPGVNTSEEVFLGGTMPRWIPYLATATALAVVITAVRFVVVIATTIMSQRRSGQRAGSRGSGRSRSTPPIVAWVTVHGLLLALANPTAPEPWIPLLVPLAALLAVNSTISTRASRAFGGLALMLAIHTLVGGWAPVRSVDTDYNVVRGRTLAADVGEGPATVVTFDSTFSRWIAYRYGWNVIEIGVLSAEELDDALVEIGSSGPEHPVFITDEVVHPRPWGGGADTARSQVNEALAQWGERMVVVGENQFGTLYGLQPTDR